METTRHFTVSTYILNSENKLLLHLHKKLNFWIPVGGHIDENELPTLAAIREAKEESGLDVELLDFDNLVNLVDAENIIRPLTIMVQDVGADHQHIDLGYIARTKSTEILPNEGESIKLEWFDLNEMNNINTPENVKEVYKLILEKIK